MAEEKKNDYLESIKKLRTENRKLKKENKFLIERENKLQTIEQMFVNKQVDLKELNEIILKTVQK